MIARQLVDSAVVQGLLSVTIVAAGDAPRFALAPAMAKKIPLAINAPTM